MFFERVTMSHPPGVKLHTRRLFRQARVYLLATLALLPLSAESGNFAVTPLRLDFDQSTKSGAITINNDAESALKVQLGLYEWTQDETGKDIYRESEDLLYFPRLATIGPGERRVVRVGLRQPAATLQEKSYRLYVEELPKTLPSGGTQLGVAIRFGVPLFVKPLNEKPRGVIERLTMAKGELKVKVRNTGNIHFKIASVMAASGERFSDEVGGWYLLPGAAREYVIDVPADLCGGLGRIDVAVTTDQLQLEGALDAKPAMCSE